MTCPTRARATAVVERAHRSRERHAARSRSLLVENERRTRDRRATRTRIVVNNNRNSDVRSMSIFGDATSRSVPSWEAAPTIGRPSFQRGLPHHGLITHLAGSLCERHALYAGWPCASAAARPRSMPTACAASDTAPSRSVLSWVRGSVNRSSARVESLPQRFPACASSDAASRSDPRGYAGPRTAAG